MKKIHVGPLMPTHSKPGCAECLKRVCKGCGGPFTLSTSDDPGYCSRQCNPEEMEKRKK